MQNIFTKLFSISQYKIDKEYYRFFGVFHYISLLGCIGHFYFIFLFFFGLKLKFLALYNILSCTAFGFANLLNRKGRHFQALCLVILEVSVFTVLTVVFLGWDTGFYYYLMLLPALFFYYPLKSTFLKIFIGLFFSLFYMGLYQYARMVLPIVMIERRFIELSHGFNVPLVIASLSFFGYYYHKAAREAEFALEKSLRTQHALEKQQIEQEKLFLAREMELARDIQNAILPARVEHDELEIAHIMRPADEVGGDYYDIISGKDGKQWFTIGDVSGHGVTPGLIMMMAQTIFITLTTQNDLTPREVIVRLNRILYYNVTERIESNHFMTFTALKYMGEGKFLHAGLHTDLIVYREKSGRCELIETSGMFLNFIPDIERVIYDSSFTLEKGDILFLFTDGLYEVRNSSRELLDIPRLADIVKRHVQKDVEEMKNAIINEVLAWCRNKSYDDMALVIVKRI